MLSCLFKRRVLSMMSYVATAPLPKYAANSQPFTVLVEGNIGSGKTTFIQHFQQFDNKVCAITEPVKKWRNLNGHNLLELMYKDPERWSMPFQSYVTLTMLQGHTKQTDKPIKLMERSLFSARYCFIENMYKNGRLHKAMYDVLQEWYKFIDEIIHMQVDLIVYLRTTPEVVYERIRRRARSEEACVPLEYIKQLHELHENWLVHRHFGNTTKVLEIEADLDLSEIDREYKRSENVFNASIQERPHPMAVTVSHSQRSDFLC